MATDFPFHVLVVEDDRDWTVDMTKALRNAIGGRAVEFQFATNKRSASAALKEMRYHAVSIDQNIPDSDGGEAKAEFGLSFCEELVLSCAVSVKIVYTAFGESRYANRTGLLGKSQYIEKNISGIDEASKAQLSAPGWGQRVIELLDTRYLHFALELGGERLPLALAEGCRLVGQAWKTRSGNRDDVVTNALHLWEICLELCFAQTLALCRDAEVRMARAPSDRLAEKEKLLQEAWKALDGGNWLAPWRRYIGRENDTYPGQTFLEKCSQPCRQLRNDRAHMLKNAPPIHFEKIKVPLHHLSDVLAFWIETPLLVSPRLHPTMTGRVIGKALAGDRPPFSDWEVEMPGLRGRLVPEVEKPDDHVYVPWISHSEPPRLIDLHPFVAMERDPRSGQQHLFVFSHRTPKGEWWRRSLTDGAVRPWRPTHQELTMLGKLFPQGSGPGRR